MYKFITLSLASLAFGSSLSPALVGRQLSTCESHSGYKTCGSRCIPITYSCCVALSAGCPTGEYCSGNGCCPIGQICSGGGGVDVSTLTDTRTIINTITNIHTETATATATETEETVSTSTEAETETATETETEIETETETPTPTATSSHPIIPINTAVPPSSTPTPSATPSASATGEESSTASPSSPLFTGGATNVRGGLGAIAGLIAGVALL